jgi:phosphodiesterase/alkaline phosphatase D-like protein
MPGLLLGPVLRHVGEHDATVWVETDGRCVVTVSRGDATASERTFAVAGHHYAIVALTGLEAGTALEYRVDLDREPAWPDPELRLPPSLIRTVDPRRPVHLLFGSCRSPHTVVVRDPTGSGEDVLVAYAHEMLTLPVERWPDAVLMLGDQVYADEPSKHAIELFARRRDLRRPPHAQAADFEDYTILYREAWGERAIRWFMSTVPSSMIFDDHDVIDDWNTSAAWRRDVLRSSWWRERITAAFSSYWVYQHLGNLSAEGLAADPLYAQVRTADDAEPLLRAFAQRADGEADGGPPVMWSYRRDFGRTRLLTIDSRAGRVLEEGERMMVSEAEFAWIEQQLADGEIDHLVIATSVPWLLPRALHDLESADEALAGGARGRALARIAEWLRRAVDLEHWAAFRKSFDRLANLIAAVGSGKDGRKPPATICVLSGDVHHTYASEVRFPDPMRSKVYQLTCSPFHNSIPLPMRLVFRVAWGPHAESLARRLARFAGVPDVPMAWRTIAGPYFGNHLSELWMDGRRASLTVAKSAKAGDGTRALPEDDATCELAGAPVEPDAVHVSEAA